MKATRNNWKQLDNLRVASIVLGGVLTMLLFVLGASRGNGWVVAAAGATLTLGIAAGMVFGGMADRMATEIDDALLENQLGNEE